MASSLLRSTVKKWNKWLILSLILLPIVAVFYQMVVFGDQCRIYSEQALKLENNLVLDASPHEAVVVLTGDRGRIPKAFDLLKRRQSLILIISGAGKNTTLTDLVNQQGIAPKLVHEVWGKILLESKSSSTVENAIETGKVIDSLNINEIILITSEYHMARASAIFSKTLPNLKIQQYPVRSDVSQIDWDLSARTLQGIWLFWNEFWKMILYRVYVSHQIQAL